ncbi:hypothetical protein PR048_006432 [Dryococelus australis]|uniref:CRIB domain-containing protein n=1 Tax=Dryococelus australis TaxID=614101 RepID=A0ABQ9IB03_9NEOP|nr:hypothetical protein PR048_006432 [Dryococelus australis]
MWRTRKATTASESNLSCNQAPTALWSPTPPLPPPPPPGNELKLPNNWRGLISQSLHTPYKTTGELHPVIVDFCQGLHVPLDIANPWFQLSRTSSPPRAPTSTANRSTIFAQGLGTSFSQHEQQQRLSWELPRAMPTPGKPVALCVLVSPVLAGLAVGIGVPILLFYVYGVVPVSLCRSGGCGVSTSGAGVRFEFDDENDLLGVLGTRNTDAVSMDAVSHRGANPSIGEVSLSLGSGSQLERLGRENDRESASNVALAGASIAGSITSSVVPGGQRSHVTHTTIALLRTWHWECIPHLPHSLDLTPSDLCLFGKMKCRQFASDDKLKDGVKWLNEQDATFYHQGMENIILQYDKCLNKFGHSYLPNDTDFGDESALKNQHHLYTLEDYIKILRLPFGVRLEVQADVASTQRFSMSSETASAATSLSEKSVSVSIADDGAASTRALAGSVLNFKVDSSAEVHADDEAAGPASLSSLEELSSGTLSSGHIRRVRRRPPLDRQVGKDAHSALRFRPIFEHVTHIGASHYNGTRAYRVRWGTSSGTTDMWPEIVLFAETQRRRHAVAQRGILLLSEISLPSRKVKLVPQFTTGCQHPAYFSSIQPPSSYQGDKERQRLQRRR